MATILIRKETINPYKIKETTYTTLFPTVPSHKWVKSDSTLGNEARCCRVTKERSFLVIFHWDQNTGSVLFAQKKKSEPLKFPVAEAKCC